jgi:hypothetical protein
MDCDETLAVMRVSLRVMLGTEKPGEYPVENDTQFMVPTETLGVDKELLA